MAARTPSPARSRRQGTAHGQVAEQLRRDIRGNRFPPGASLPTEAELGETFGVSRQTIRRAYQDLVAEGLVHRIPGRGTFVNDRRGKYIRSSGSIDELLALSLDTDLDVVEPPGLAVNIEAAGRLQLDTDEVVALRFRRVHLDRPYCLTDAYLPVAVGLGLLAVPQLKEPGMRRNMTVLNVVQEVAGTAIAGADQMITAVAATPDVADQLECRVGDPVLRIDRLYFDHAGELLELAINHFNPSRYTYRFQMRATGR